MAHRRRRRGLSPVAADDRLISDVDARRLGGSVHHLARYLDVGARRSFSEAVLGETLDMRQFVRALHPAEFLGRLNVQSRR